MLSTLIVIGHLQRAPIQTLRAQHIRSVAGANDPEHLTTAHARCAEEFTDSKEM
jgi:hypothetical protein